MLHCPRLFDCQCFQNCCCVAQLHQQTLASEEFTLLKQLQLEQRMGRAQTRFAALVAVCAASEVPGIRPELVLQPPNAHQQADSDPGSQTVPRAGARPSEDSEAALTALLTDKRSAAASASPQEQPSASGPAAADLTDREHSASSNSSSAGAMHSRSAAPGCSSNGVPGATEAVVATLDLHNVKALADEVLIGNSSNPAYLANVCVAEQARRRGVGSQLLDAARNMTREWGKPHLPICI